MLPTRPLPLVLTAALVAVMAFPCEAAKRRTFVPVEDTSWLTERVARASVRFRQRVQHVRGGATAAIDFGPLDESETPTGDFDWLFTDTNDDTLDVGGTYVLTPRGKPILTIDPALAAVAVEDMFNALLEDEFNGALPPGVTLAYTVRRANARFAAWETRSGVDRASSRLLLKFVVRATGNGRTIRIYVTLRHNAIGGRALE